ncbi:MAG: ABC transporter ATP-binding protein [Actinomycetota bacterium]
MPLSPDSEPFIRVRDLRFRYTGATHDALWIQSFEVDQPGLVAITGPSGAGKSTLVELLAGTLNQRYSGRVEVLGTEWTELRGDRARQFHLRRIGLIPQDLGLLPSQTARQMLLQALTDADVPRAECDDRIARALTRVDLLGFADRRIAELSGGQKQRVAIARALARNVELILADEPTANLHVELADETLAVLQRIAATIPVVMVTHDPRMAARCDRQVRVNPPSGSGLLASSTAVTAAAPAAAALPVLIPIPSASSAARVAPAAFAAPQKAAASPTAATSRALRASADPPPRVWPAPAGARSTGSSTPASSGVRATPLVIGSASAPGSASTGSAFSRMGTSASASTSGSGSAGGFSRPASSRAPVSSRLTLASLGTRPRAASGSVPSGSEDDAPGRKPTVLMAAACACGVAAILGVLFAGPLASHPTASKGPTAAAAPAVTATQDPTTGSSQATPATPAASPAAPATTTPATTTPATTAPATTTNPVTQAPKTVSHTTTTKPATTPSTPAAASPAAQQAAIIATSTPNVTSTPTTTAAATNPYSAWLTFMQAFMGGRNSTTTP